MPSRESRGKGDKAGELAELRGRALFMLDVFDAAEPSPTWAAFRDVVERGRLSDLRSILRDLRGAASGLTSDARAQLDRALLDRFGPDEHWHRDRELVAQVRARGRIRSEREYRAVQGYADAIGGDPANQAEFLALGALLDEFSAAR